MAGLPIVPAVRVSTRSGSSRPNLESGHRFFYRVTGVIFRICFVFDAMLCNLVNDFLGIVAAREARFAKAQSCSDWLRWVRGEESRLARLS